ncbi:conserved hypothetical protein [Gammaproteobacteria bacterium]
MTLATKLLSIVLCGKNDNYLGDFKYRIQSAINYAGINCTKAGFQDMVEILIVDWNSDTPLSQELKLLPDAYDMCRYVEVPSGVASSYHLNGRQFNTEAAANAGLRRSMGRYAMFVPADILLTETLFRNLMAILSKQVQTTFNPAKTALYLDRKIIPWQIVEKKFTLQEWDRYIQLCGRNLFHDRYYIGLNGGYGGLLLHRDLWAECQGFAENNDGWAITDTEWGLRINQKYAGVSLASLGVMLYDMSQKPSSMLQRKPGRLVTYSNQLHRNNPGWGLGNYDLKQTKGIPGIPTTAPPALFIRPDPAAAMEKIRDVATNLVPKLPGAAQIPSGSAEQILLASLAWYCTTYLPIRYLEFNCHAGLSTLAFAGLCPYGEIYSIDDYEEFDQNQDFQRYLDSLPHGRLYSMNFQGHSQIVTGEGSSALERLEENFSGEFRFDLVVLRCDMFKTLAPRQQVIDKILATLPFGGALLITSKLLESFNELLPYLQSVHYRHFFLQSTNVPFIFLMKA